MIAAYALATGNPFDGLTMTGPFDSAERATNYAEDHYEADTWWVLALTTPEG